MMKSHLFLFAVFILTFSASGQTTVDLQVSFIQPQDEQNLQAGEVYVAMLNLKNEGPNTFQTNDTLWLHVTFSGTPTPDPIYITGQMIPPHGEIPISQQIGFDQSWIGNSCEVCMRIIPLNASILLTDPDTSNNEDCITVHIVSDVTGANELSEDEARIYPVPANDFFRLKTVENVQRIAAIDASGAATELTWSGEIVDCSHLQPGCYFLQVETESKINHWKLIIQH
jgi:hypothetical protein